MKTLREVLQDAERDKVAIGHFNFSDLVAFNAIVAAARELKVPVMAGVSEGEREFTGVAQAAALVKAVRDEYDYPIFLNADHTHSLAKAEEAAKYGYDEVIFDGLSLTFEENVAQTKRAVEALKSINPEILVEGEIGWIGASSTVMDNIPEGVGVLTTPAEAPRYKTNRGDQSGLQYLHDSARRLRHQRRRFQARYQSWDDDRSRQHRAAPRLAARSRGRTRGEAQRVRAV